MNRNPSGYCYGWYWNSLRCPVGSFFIVRMCFLRKYTEANDRNTIISAYFDIWFYNENCGQRFVLFYREAIVYLSAENKAVICHSFWRKKGKRKMQGKKVITKQRIEEFCTYLKEEEKSRATVEKYRRDLEKLVVYADGREITKELMISYKAYLLESGEFKVSSINSFLVAANRFLGFCGWYEAAVHIYRVQKESFTAQEQSISKEEYARLVTEAERLGKGRLSMILQTLCATGIRVSELKFITVESVQAGEAQVHNKGKLRTILISGKLKERLLEYIRDNQQETGPVFLSGKGNPVDRSNLWKEIKRLSEAAGVPKEKVFPHNFRHFFAQSFYRMEKDLVKLAALLGHSSIETTRLYVKITKEECQRELDRMGVVF